MFVKQISRMIPNRMQLAEFAECNEVNIRVISYHSIHSKLT